MQNDFDEYISAPARMLQTKETKALLITKRHMEMAIHNQRFCFENFKEMLKRRDEWKNGNPDNARTSSNERALLWKALTSDPSGFVSRQYILDYTGFNPNDKAFKDGTESFAFEEDKIKIHWDNSQNNNHGAFVRQLMATLGCEWANKMKISPSFRRAPTLYEVVDKSACR